MSSIGLPSEAGLVGRRTKRALPVAPPSEDPPKPKPPRLISATQSRDLWVQERREQRGRRNPKQPRLSNASHRTTRKEDVDRAKDILMRQSAVLAAES